jgi:hypothetical protein
MALYLVELLDNHKRPDGKNAGVVSAVSAAAARTAFELLIKARAGDITALNSTSTVITDAATHEFVIQGRAVSTQRASAPATVYKQTTGGSVLGVTA